MRPLAVHVCATGFRGNAARGWCGRHSRCASGAGQRVSRTGRETATSGQSELLTKVDPLDNDVSQLVILGHGLGCRIDRTCGDRVFGKNALDLSVEAATDGADGG